MRENRVKRSLLDGGTAFGSMVFEFNTPGIGRLAGEAGADFIIIDQEHSGWSTETVKAVVAWSRGSDVVPLVRPPATEYHLLAGLLDVGAMGLMVPMVESIEQAQLIVDSCRYPPVGRRGAGFGLAHDLYTDGSNLDKMANANREVLLIAQIETAAGVEAAESIAVVDGIDVLWIGHHDLTNSLGIPGQFDHPLYLRYVERVLAAARNAGKATGMMVSDVEWGRSLLRQGFRILAYWGDLWIYKQALRSGITGLRESTHLRP